MVDAVGIRLPVGKKQQKAEEVLFGLIGHCIVLVDGAALLIDNKRSLVRVSGKKESC